MMVHYRYYQPFFIKQAIYRLFLRFITLAQFGQQNNQKAIKNYQLYMKSLGDKALQKIENFLVKKQVKPSHSPKKQKSLINFRPSKIVEDQSPKKSPIPKRKQVSPKNKTMSNIYVPREKQIKFLQKQTKMIYSELEQRVNYKIQNPHSFFLNQKNPKPPIYQRAQDIMRQRQAYLQQKRQEKIRQKQEAEQQEYQQFLKSQISKKALSKEQALLITDRLYKDHYSKTNRLNQKKIDRYKEESKYYRQKPMINNTSREIYHIVAEKNKLQSDIIDRFGQYEMQKAQKQKESLKHYKDKYTPFKPLISDNSRVLISSRDEKSHDLSRSNHCLSCHFLKSDSKNMSPLRSPGPKNFYDDQS